MAGGYMNKILMVDLSKKELRDEELPEDLRRQFVGGYGIGARMLFSSQKAGIDPLGEENILGIITGPLTGTPIPGGTRYAVVGKSPLTGCWGDSNAGGYFGPRMKFSGYDGVFFSGTSEKPVYLFLNNGKAELRSAAHIWGKSTFETEDILKAELGKDTEVACIGPSGENLSLIAAIINNKGRAAGRSGLAAVMGAKKIKAVAVRGNMEIPLADQEKVNALRRKCIKEFTGPIEFFKDIGTASFTVVHTLEGDSPIKNWGGVVNNFPDVELLGPEYVKKHRLKKYACYRCPIACGGLTKKGTGDYKYDQGAHRPEYETLSMFGSNCLNGNLDSIIMVNHICNQFGVDTISAGAAIAFAMECYENGILTKADTDGIEMTWGNHKAIVEMTKKIARREGFGAVLADGVKVAAEKIGRDAEKYAIHIQGQELPAHDPKFATELATTYKLDATPARHTQGSEERHPPGLIPEYEKWIFSGRGELHKIGSNAMHIVNSTGMCAFAYGCFPSIDTFTQSINAVTGWETTTGELLKTGERIANLRHAFNLREGLNPLNFEVPGRVYGNPPKTEGPTAGITIDQDTLFNEYLSAMDWDLNTTKPSPKKLQELDLQDVAQELWR